jgi:type I restriction enzyme S subunit
MEGWKKVKIKELAKIINGYAFKSKDFSNNGEIPIIKIKSLKDRNLVLDGGDFVSSSFLELDEKYHINYNDILIALTGSHISLPASAVGKVAKSRHQEKLLLNQRVGKFLVNPEVCNHDFLYYALTTDYFFQSVGLIAKGAANQANISGGDIGNIKIQLPSLKTQDKIATILSTYDDLIENNLKRIKLLKEKAILYYEEWFVRMKFPGHENTPINKETGLPVGWIKRKIKEIADFQNGYAFYTKGYAESGFAIIDLGNISEYGDLNITGNEKFISEELYVSLPKFHLKKYDIIIAMTDVTSALRILSKSAIIDKDDTYALNQRVGMLRPNSDLLDYSFLHALLGDPRFIARMKAMTKGAVQFYFNTKDIINYETFIPNKITIDEFVKQYKPILELRMKLKDQNQLLQEARDILLPRLMTGMIDVEQMNIETLQANAT